MTANSIIDDETGEPLEYRHLIKGGKHKNIWVKYFSNELGRPTQGVGDRLKGMNAIFSLEHKKFQNIGGRTLPMSFFLQL